MSNTQPKPVKAAVYMIVRVLGEATDENIAALEAQIKRLLGFIEEGYEIQAATPLGECIQYVLSRPLPYTGGIPAPRPTEKMG